MAKVLIIDDDIQCADVIACHVRAMGHEVAVGRSLAEGLALFSFEPEVVLLDVMLPDGNGLASIRDIKAWGSLPEVIIVTGSGDEEAAEMAVRSGAWDYWQKGRSAKGLLLPVSRALEYRHERILRRSNRTLDLNGLLGKSPAMNACFDLVREAAMCDASVLLHGETGTGKEVFARAIHKNSSRTHKPFVVVDCASLTETLIESALFGHDKGAFTGASAERAGLIRQANEGTLFLDEIGELPLFTQKSFLRVLQEKRFRPVGADRELSSDFRLLAATNRDLKQMVKAGTFREDLYFRVCSIEMILPPLRERQRDMLDIAEHLLDRVAEKAQQARKTMSAAFAEALEQYPWPGNVRELCQAVDCAVAAAGEATTLEPVHLPMGIRVKLARASVKPELNLPQPQSVGASYPTLSSARDSAVAAYLTRLLADTNGDIDAACAIAELSRSRLYELLKVHGLGRSPTTVSH